MAGAAVSATAAPLIFQRMFMPGSLFHRGTPAPAVRRAASALRVDG